MSSVSSNPWEMFDPWAAFRQMRDAYLENAADLMVRAVNTEDYAKASGTLLSAYMNAFAPAQAWMGQVMPQVLAFYGVPSRQELVSVAARMTNIEMQLDDIGAVLDDLRQQLGWDEERAQNTA